MSNFRITARRDDIDDAQAICGMCGERVPIDEIFGHLRGAHEIEVEIETWPDGSPVIVDSTLEPGDFS